MTVGEGLGKYYCDGKFVFLARPDADYRVLRCYSECGVLLTRIVFYDWMKETMRTYAVLPSVKDKRLNHQLRPSVSS